MPGCCGIFLGPSVKRIALTLEEPANTPTVELIRRVKDKLKRRLPPHEVTADQAPIYENTVTGKNIDLKSAADPAALAARWRPLCRHRRRSDHPRSRQRLSQHRHLSNDAAGQNLRSGFTSRPARTRACTSPAPGSRASRSTSPPPGASIPCSCWSARKHFQERVRIRIRRRHQGPADPGRSRQDDRSADPGQRRARR